MFEKRVYYTCFYITFGCPETCVFCNQKKISGMDTDVTKEDVKKTIDESLKNFSSDNRRVEIAFFWW